MPRSAFSASLIPPGVLPDARLLLWARGLRAFGDGYVSLLLPYYLTLLGSGVMTLAVGFIAHRFRSRALLEAASMLMVATGIAFILTTDFWPLLLIAFIGTINPSAGDVSIFAPLEHSLLTRTVSAEQ